MAFSDIDGDGDQDVLIGQYLYTNDLVILWSWRHLLKV
jgi:hypothetical protein